MQEHNSHKACWCGDRSTTNDIMCVTSTIEIQTRNHIIHMIDTMHIKQIISFTLTSVIFQALAKMILKTKRTNYQIIPPEPNPSGRKETRREFKIHVITRSGRQASISGHAFGPREWFRAILFVPHTYRIVLFLCALPCSVQEKSCITVLSRTSFLEN